MTQVMQVGVAAAGGGLDLTLVDRMFLKESLVYRCCRYAVTRHCNMQ